MNKNLRLFLSITMFMTIFVFSFLYWLLTRSGEPLVPLDTAIVFLIAMLLGAAVAGIVFCICRLREVGGLITSVVAALVAMNRKPVLGGRPQKPLLQPRYYFVIKEHNFEMRDASSGVAHKGLTRIAIDTDNSVLVVGEPEELNKLQGYIREHLFYGSIVSWFDNDRKVVKDARGLVTTLKTSMRQLARQFFFSPTPIVIFHIVDKPAYAPEESAMIQFMGDKIGALDVFIWNGRELYDDEIVNGQFPADHWVGKMPNWAKV